MKFLELTRLETSPDSTIGVLTLDKKVFCYILEPPKKENTPGESCIPTGQYLCKRYDSQKFQCPCLAVHNVQGREYIAMHYGNTANDTKGCLIVGAYTGYLSGKRAVLRSKATLQALMSDLKDICHLTIRERF